MTACTTALAESAIAPLLCQTKGTVIHRNPVLIWKNISIRLRTPNAKTIDTSNYCGFAPVLGVRIVVFAGPMFPWM